MKRRIRLSERDLHRVINQVINEAYGTPDKDTQSNIDRLSTNYHQSRLTFGDKANKERGFGFTDKTELLKVIGDDVEHAANALVRLRIEDSVYVKALKHHIYECQKILRRVYKEELMKLGAQPNETL